MSEATDRRLDSIRTSLGRVRCPRPAQIERMKESLAAHGQLMPVVVVERGAKFEVLDGFKRHAAATAMGWTTLRVSTTNALETAQWALMLTLNRGAQSMTEFEEALVLREIESAGLTQKQIAQLVQRHKSWVSRRIGLVERLHPELVESVRLGLLHPAVARRLLVLPAGNQLSMAAVAQKVELRPHETERWVSLWRRASNAEVRQYILTHPREALREAYPETPDPGSIDPRLSPHGQRVMKMLRVVRSVSLRLQSLLVPSPPLKDQAILEPEVRATTEAIEPLLSVLGRCRKDSVVGGSGANGATS